MLPRNILSMESDIGRTIAQLLIPVYGTMLTPDIIDTIECEHSMHNTQDFLLASKVILLRINPYEPRADLGINALKRIK